MVGGEAINYVRRYADTQIVIVDATTAQTRNFPRILLTEEKHVRGISYLGLIRDHALAIAAHEGILTVTVLSYDRY